MKAVIVQAKNEGTYERQIETSNLRVANVPYGSKSNLAPHESNDLDVPRLADHEGIEESCFLRLLGEDKKNYVLYLVGQSCEWIGHGVRMCEGRSCEKENCAEVDVTKQARWCSLRPAPRCTLPYIK